MNGYIRATYDLTRDIDVYIEAVHRLTDLGGLVTHVGTGTTQEGSDAEWRVVDVYSIEDGQINRCEMFDENGAFIEAPAVRLRGLSTSASVTVRVPFSRGLRPNKLVLAP